MTISLDLGINTGMHKNGINSLLERLDGLIRFDGVLSCNVIADPIAQIKNAIDSSIRQITK